MGKFKYCKMDFIFRWFCIIFKLNFRIYILYSINLFNNIVFILFLIIVFGDNYKLEIVFLVIIVLIYIFKIFKFIFNFCDFIIIGIFFENKIKFRINVDFIREID